MGMILQISAADQAQLLGIMADLGHNGLMDHDINEYGRSKFKLAEEAFVGITTNTPVTGQQITGLLDTLGGLVCSLVALQKHQPVDDGLIRATGGLMNRVAKAADY